MTRTDVRIGEHRIRLGFKTDRFVPYARARFASPVADADADAPPDIAIDVEDGYGGPFQGYDVAVRRDEDTISFRRADYFIEANATYASVRLRAHDELAFKHALMTVYSAFIVHNRWGLLLHSSCVVGEDGFARMFAGPSGAGKSTAAALSLPRRVLSDEATLVSLAGSRPIVYDSPFRSELEGEPGAAPAPLGGAYLLRQWPTHERRAVPKADAMLALLDKVFYWRVDAEDTGKAVALLRALVDAVPVGELRFHKDPGFWELIS